MVYAPKHRPGVINGMQEDTVILVNRLYNIQPTSFETIKTALSNYRDERFDNGKSQYSTTHMSARLQFGHEAGLRDMRKALNAVRYANSEAELQEKWLRFQHLFPGQTTMIGYINNNWMKPDKVVRWVLYLREDYQHINANNLVESWMPL
ncbi:hypothetical protein BGZ47_007079 [Haplosporangium gracile]|nr:hypothetical protein BGZ47_007079 [Haplosporangium gracile]